MVPAPGLPPGKRWHRDREGTRRGEVLRVRRRRGQSWRRGVGVACEPPEWRRAQTAAGFRLEPVEAEGGDTEWRVRTVKRGQLHRKTVKVRAEHRPGPSRKRSI